MPKTAYAGPSASEIYRSGLETLVAASRTVVAGEIGHYEKTVTSSSAGAESIPLTWIVSAQLEQPQTLKGAPPPAPVGFTRAEQSPLLPPVAGASSQPEGQEGLSPDGMVALFYQGSAERPAIVLPGGENPVARFDLLKEIVAIQAISNPSEQTAAWLAYLGRCRTGEARQVALRSLLHLNIAWPALAPAAERLMADPSTDQATRSFLFGIVTYALVHDRFAAPHADVARFLCHAFLAARDDRLSLQYLLQLKLLLRYTEQEEARQSRLPLRQQVIAALKQRAAQGNLSSQLEEQYRQIRSAYPEVR